MTDTTSRPGGTTTLAGRDVARIGYGAMALERLDDDRDAAVALLHRAVDLGVDHVDTADFYGHSVANEIIRSAFGNSSEVAVVSKVGAVRVDAPVPLAPAQRPAELRAQVEANLRSLGRDRIDVVNLRRLDVGPGIVATADQLVPIDDQLAEMTAMRDEGLIGGIGLSAVPLATLRHALPAGIACVQNGYSLVSREFEDMLELCVAEGIAWVPYFPLGSAFPGLPKVVDVPAVRAAATDLGVTPAQVGLAWLLGHAPDVLLIPGTASVQHLVENVAVGDLRLGAEHTAALDGVWAERLAAGETGTDWP